MKNFVCFLKIFSQKAKCINFYKKAIFIMKLTKKCEKTVKIVKKKHKNTIYVMSL